MNIHRSNSFAQLFKKYRLQSGFSSLTSFGLKLAEKGFIYEDSIFSHWQRGTRIPRNRTVLLRIIDIFAEKKAISTVNQANELLSSAGEPPLTSSDMSCLTNLLENEDSNKKNLFFLVVSGDMLQSLMMNKEIQDNVFMIDKNSQDATDILKYIIK